MLNRLCLAIALMVAPLALLAQQGPTFRQRLEQLLASDQKYRGSNRSGTWEQVAAKQEALDRANVIEVERLIEVHGWPRLSEVGEDAALAAFLVIQHADLATQERYLPMLESRVWQGEAKGVWLALLTDRILVGRTGRQRYGTQFRFNPATRKTEPIEIENPAQVNERREALGMKAMVPRQD